MPASLVALSVDANDPSGLATFWAGVLGWEMTADSSDGPALLPSDDTAFRIRFLPAQEQKAGPNQTHVDLTSTSLEDQQQTVAPGFVRTPMTERNTFPMPFMVSPEEAARAIADGMAKDKAEIVFPLPMMMLMKAARLVPVRAWTAATAAMTRRGVRQ